MRKFDNPDYGSFDGPWADFFIDLGEHVVKNTSGDSRIILLTPTDKVIPFLISIGAMKTFLTSDISTGFLPIDEIWEQLKITPLGTEVHVIDKTIGFTHYKGGLSSLSDNSFYLKIIEKDGGLERGWQYFPEDGRKPAIDVSIMGGRNFSAPERPQTEQGDPNLHLLGEFYSNSDPMGVLGLPNNLIQIIGNKNTLTMESHLRFLKDGISGNFGDILITKNAISRERELTYLGAAKEENLKNEVNLSIFVQGKYANITNLIDWTNSFPQILIIPRTSRQSYDLVEMCNDEYLSREESIDFSELNVPNGCEIMGYKI
jgi:hypothetical protein